METKYKLICVNLKRRNDRREEMIKKFEAENVTDYCFFEAVDGKEIQPKDERLSLFRFSNPGILKCGVLGCALSHYAVWNNLVTDPDNDYYIILEDDIRLCQNFKENLNKIIEKLPIDTNILTIGMTIEMENFDKTRSIYRDDVSYMVYPFNTNMFAGGFFGYIISKKCAKILTDHIKNHGIMMTIDYLPYRLKLFNYESHPHLVFTNAVQHSIVYVDSDIQKDLNQVITVKPINNYVFDDYVFFPNKDYAGYDIIQAVGDIPSIKKMAGYNKNCVSFNTHGWIKHTVPPISINEFIYLENKYNIADGIYIKKQYIDPNLHKTNKEILEQKITILRNKLCQLHTRINIFVNKNALLYAMNIVEMILANFPDYLLVYDATNKYDVSINHIVDSKLHYTNDSFNILISGEPIMTNFNFDLAIDTKLYQNAKSTIYFPFAFSSLREHKKSIDPKDYIKPNRKFCAYMYNMVHDHRIRYFNLMSSYKRVDALGKCCKNTVIEDTRTVYNKNETYVDIAVDIYSNYKFVIAVENNFVPGYSTEKLMNPLIANSVPLYWGDDYIFNYINKKRVVYLNDFKSDEDLLKYIEYLDTNEAAYNEIIQENIYVDNFSLTSMEILVQNEIHRFFGF